MSLLLKNKKKPSQNQKLAHTLSRLFEFTFWYQIRKNRPKARKRVRLSKVRKKWGRVRRG